MVDWKALLGKGSKGSTSSARTIMGVDGQHDDRTGGLIYEAVLAERDPVRLKVLKGITTELIVVYGHMDHIERVLDTMGVSYKLVMPTEVSNLSLSPRQAVFIDCPGSGIDRKGLATLEDFVTKGGALITTDWAVKNVVEVLFSGTIQYTGKSTSDDVVALDMVGKSKALVGLDAVEGANPKWWLESGSYPISVVRGDVETLLRSAELETKYHSPHVAVTFPQGLGRVYHFVSHLYLQRAELRNARDASSSTDFATSLGVKGTVDWTKARPTTATSRAEADYSTASALGNIITDHLAGSQLDAGKGAAKKVHIGPKATVQLVPHYEGVCVRYEQQTVGGPLIVTVNGEGVLIGRGDDARLRLDDTLVSRKHAHLALQDGCVKVMDMASRNGTFYNGKRVVGSGVSLEHGGKLQIGRGYFEVRMS